MAVADTKAGLELMTMLPKTSLVMLVAIPSASTAALATTSEADDGILLIVPVALIVPRLLILWKQETIWSIGVIFLVLVDLLVMSIEVYNVTSFVGALSISCIWLMVPKLELILTNRSICLRDTDKHGSCDQSLVHSSFFC